MKVNHLLYMNDLKLYGKSKDDLEALMNSVRIFIDDKNMKFGASKCAILVMKRGRKMEDDGIQMHILYFCCACIIDNSFLMC